MNFLQKGVCKMSREERKRWFEGFIKAMNDEGWRVNENEMLHCPPHATDDDRELEESDFANDFKNGFSTVCIDCGKYDCDCSRQFKIRE